MTRALNWIVGEVRLWSIFILFLYCGGFCFAYLFIGCFVDMEATSPVRNNVYTSPLDLIYVGLCVLKPICDKDHPSSLQYWP